MLFEFHPYLLCVLKTSLIMKSCSSGLCVGHLNVYHLYNKVPDVCVLLNKSNKPVHLFGMSEARLDSRHDDCLLNISNYSLLRRDKSHIGHTGLVVYIHESIKNVTNRRPDLESENVESIWVEVKHSKSPSLLVGYVYRNPASTLEWLDDFVKMMDKVSECNTNILILGDFNYDLNKPQTTWITTTSLYGLHQMVKNPTRTANSKESLLDHIYTNNKSMILQTSVSNESISDHFPIFCTLSLKPPKRPAKGHTTIEYRCFKNFDKNSFLFDLASVSFQNVYNFTDPNAALSALYDAFMSVIDKHTPIRKKRVKHPTIPPWLNPDIIKAMSLRDFYKENKMKAQYKQQRNKVRDMVRDAKKDYFNKLISDKKDIASIWRAINEVVHNSRKGSQKSTVKISPNDFNDHFLSLPEKLLSSAQGVVEDNHYECPTLL